MKDAYEWLDGAETTNPVTRARPTPCRCTKLRVISVLCIVLVSWILILYSCVDEQAYRACCTDTGLEDTTTPSVQQHPRQHRGDGSLNANDYRRRLPQCVIIGVRKGGTRALLQFISLHPNIETAALEAHFFDREENFSLGLDWYRRHMPISTPEQITIEKTPSYFNEPDVPKRVYEMNSTIRLILIVRDPVERAISDYTQIHYNKVVRGKYHVPFRELSIDAKTGSVRKTYIAVKRSLYYRHLLRWLEYFSLDSILILDSRDLVNEPFVAVRKVENFLGLPNKLDEANFYFNRTRGFYCMKKDDRHRCLSSSKGRPHVPVDEETVKTLRDFFRPFNRKFYNIVGRDFEWP